MQRREALKISAVFMGYAVSAGALSEFLTSCASSKGLSGKPEFLAKPQFNTIGAMANVILPRTATPGAKDLHVERFIDKMLKELLSPEDQQSFMKGLMGFEASCIKKYGQAFTSCSADIQLAALKQLEQEASKYPPSMWGISLANAEPPHFFRTIKDLTLTGFYTSEAIGMHVLSYDPLPGAYIGCMPLSEVGNAWNEG